MTMRFVLTVVVIIELYIAYILLYPACNLRGDMLRAFHAWTETPTQETRAELDRQRRITQIKNLGFCTVFFMVMAGPTALAAWMWRRRHPIVTQSKNDRLEA